MDDFQSLEIQPLSTPSPEISKSVEEFTPLAIRPEIPPITPEARQKNYETTRNGFLDIDNDGRSNVGGVCKETFEQLRAKCGDPSTWTTEDMARPEIHDLVLAYRTFGRLQENMPLIASEQAILKRLLDSQQSINTVQDGRMKADVAVNNSQQHDILAKDIGTNQAKINEIRSALSKGIKMQQQRFATSTTGGELAGITARWAEPGTDMGAELTSAVVKLYDYTLRMSDKDRASRTFPNELVSGSQALSPAEQALLLQKLLDKLKEIKKTTANKKTEIDLITKLRKLAA